MRKSRQDGTDPISPRTPGAYPTTPERGSKGGEASAPTAPPAAPPSPPTVGPQAPPPGAAGPRSRPPMGPGAGLGIALIVIGLLILVTRLVPGLAWWTLWPLVIVGAGLFTAFTPGPHGWGIYRLFDGLSTAAIGLVILAVTTGYVGFGVFWEIVHLWPVLLIALGLELLGKANHSSWVRAVGSIVVIAALAYAVAVSATGSPDPIFRDRGEGAVADATINEPVEQVRSAELELEAGAANVTLAGGSALVEATGSSPWSTPEFKVTRSGKRADISLSLGEGVATVPDRASARLDALVSRAVVWDMKIDAGVAKVDADLSDVAVRSVELKPGVATVAMRLGSVPRGVDEATVYVEAGVSSVSIEVPDEVEARIVSESGLTGHTIGGRFEETGDRAWETPGYVNARGADKGVWMITLKSGVGSIKVDTY